MKRYALDASFVIEFLNGGKTASEFLMKNQESRKLIPSPAELEIRRGLENMRSFEKLETVSFGSEEVKTALELIDCLEDQGEMIGLVDVMIASICVENSLKLLTFDEDFEKIDYEEFECRFLYR